MSYIPDPEPLFDGEPLTDVNFDSEEVLKKLKKKSPGPDGLHPRVLREVADILTEPLPLTVIFNKSVTEGKVPDGWKIAHVTAIFKTRREIVLPLVICPVSLNFVICKLMESLLRDQIMSFLNEDKLLNEHQHGFRSGRSCVTQLIDVLDTWTGMLEEDGGLDVAYLDFSKAFDPGGGGVLSPKSYVDVPADLENLISLYQFFAQLPSHQYTILNRKAPNFSQIGFFLQ